MRWCSSEKRDDALFSAESVEGVATEESPVVGISFVARPSLSDKPLLIAILSEEGLDTEDPAAPIRRSRDSSVALS